jgi:hypothetical protein
MYALETGKLRGETKHSVKRFNNSKELLASLDRIAEDVIEKCQNGLRTSLRALDLDVRKDVLKAKLLRVWEAVEADYKKSGCLPITSIFTEDDIVFAKLSQRCRNANHVFGE